MPIVEPAEEQGSFVLQWWDQTGERAGGWAYSPQCEPIAEGVVYPDANGDGFCRVDVHTDGYTTVNLRTTRAR